MKKSFVLFGVCVILIGLALVFISPWKTTNEVEAKTKKDFEIVKTEHVTLMGNYRIVTLVYKPTKVLYCYTEEENGGNVTSLTMMVDADGKPLLYKK